MRIEEEKGGKTGWNGDGMRIQKDSHSGEDCVVSVRSPA